MFSSLAGSLFNVRLSAVETVVPVVVSGTLGLNADSQQSAATYVAAAGVCSFVITFFHTQTNVIEYVKNIDTGGPYSVSLIKLQRDMAIN